MNGPTETTHPPSSENSGLSAFRKAAFVAVLLGFLTPLRPLVILFVAIVALGYVLRFAYSFYRPLGLTLIGLVAAATCFLGSLQYAFDRQYKSLQNKLAAYPDVTIRCEYFPLPKIPQLSVGDGVSDNQLLAILKLDALKDVTELYLESGDLSDAALGHVGSRFKLDYIFIDCANMTDDAILSFERRFPDCTVIPYRRDLHDDRVEVYLGPPPNSE